MVRVIQTLLAVLERYPKLKANENFLMLQKQLSKIEGQIAASRSFYNDSVMLYNTQIGKFPYLLFAGLVGLRSIEYLEFEYEN